MTEEYIYEKLVPDEVLIIAKVDRTIIYATNRNGELIIKRAVFPKDITA
mgnify:CR=1 FL=1